MPRHITVVCALIERDHRLLVAKRSKTSTMPGKWELPGGKVQASESPEQAIVREIREELGCVVHPIGRLESNIHDYPHVTVTLIPLCCGLIEGEPIALEHAELRWAGHSELRDLDWADADVPIVERYLAGR
jgi:8-oxo-dGTP diphosphatase